MITPVCRPLPMRLWQACTAVLLVWSTFSVAYAENWSQFRGPRGDGISFVSPVPATWQPEAVAWNIELPGGGHSSPVIWGDTVFVTTSDGAGQVRELHAIELATGAVKWSRKHAFQTHDKHAKSSYASSTPAVDEERVYVLFADPTELAVIAYQHNGDLAWRISLGTYDSKHGLGASPILFEDLLIVPNDQDGPSSVVAIDRRSGQVIWTNTRVYREVSYATPLLLELPRQKPQLICVAGATGVTSLDPWSGELNWAAGPFPKRTVGTPVFGGGLVLAGCGQGAKGALMVGVQPDGSGNVEETHVKLRLERGLPYVPSPIASDDLLYLWGDQGTVSCLELPSGKPVWQERVSGAYAGSPILADGKLLCLSEEGELVAINAGREYKELGRTNIGDPSYSTPAISQGKLLLRTHHRLICVRTQPVDSMP